MLKYIFTDLKEELNMTDVTGCFTVIKLAKTLAKELPKRLHLPGRKQIYKRKRELKNFHEVRDAKRHNASKNSMWYDNNSCTMDFLWQ